MKGGLEKNTVRPTKVERKEQSKTEKHNGNRRKSEDVIKDN